MITLARAARPSTAAFVAVMSLDGGNLVQSDGDSLME
eukprot:SAG22_NODE_1697_length_3790_cov_1.813601_5_plen_37_part_00